MRFYEYLRISIYCGSVGCNLSLLFHNDIIVDATQRSILYFLGATTSVLMLVGALCLSPDSDLEDAPSAALKRECTETYRSLEQCLATYGRDWRKCQEYLGEFEKCHRSAHRKVEVESPEPRSRRRVERLSGASSSTVELGGGTGH